MRESRLVQRLDLPNPRGGLLGRDNPFAFGGGLKNGGLSDNAMDLLRPIFSFDYMGAAEFEFGAVPEALDRMAHSDLTAFTFSILLAKVAPHWKERDKPAPSGYAQLYALCPVEFAEEVPKRVARWAAKPYGELKEATHMSEVLRPLADEEYPTRTRGWLELDNGFFVFADEAMWRATCDLFGVNVVEVV